MAYACFLRCCMHHVRTRTTWDFLKVQRKLLKIDFIQQQTQKLRTDEWISAQLKTYYIVCSTILHYCICYRVVLSVLSVECFC